MKQILLRLFERVFSKQIDIISKSDPNRTTVAEVAGVFCVSPTTAKFLLDLATRLGDFTQEDDGSYKIVDRTKK